MSVLMVKNTVEKAKTKSRVQGLSTTIIR